MRRALAALAMLAALLGGAGQAMADGQAETDRADLPGGGTVAAPEGFTRAKPVLLGEPTDHLLFLRGRTTNIGGNVSWRAALVVANSSQIDAPIVERAAPFLKDADWVYRTHYDPVWARAGAPDWRPLDAPGADRAEILEFGIETQGWFRKRQEPAIIARAEGNGRQAALFAMADDYDADAAAAMLSAALGTAGDGPAGAGDEAD